MADETAQFGFGKALHLRRPADFRLVFDQKCSVRDAILIAYGRTNDLNHPRLGLSVSRKAGPAVVRNRLRRLYREAFRLTRAALPPGIDLVLIPCGGKKPTLQELMDSLPKLARLLAKKLSRGVAAT